MPGLGCLRPECCLGPLGRLLGNPRVAGCDRLAYCEVLADAGERLAPAGVGDGIVGLSMGDHSLAGAIDQARPVAVGLNRETVRQLGKGDAQASGDPLAGRRLGPLGQLRAMQRRRGVRPRPAAAASTASAARPSPSALRPIALSAASRLAGLRRSPSRAERIVASCVLERSSSWALRVRRPLWPSYKPESRPPWWRRAVREPAALLGALAWSTGPGPRRWCSASPGPGATPGCSGRHGSRRRWPPSWAWRRMRCRPCSSGAYASSWMSWPSRGSI